MSEATVRNDVVLLLLNMLVFVKGLNDALLSWSCGHFTYELKPGTFRSLQCYVTAVRTVDGVLF